MKTKKPKPCKWCNGTGKHFTCSENYVGSRPCPMCKTVEIPAEPWITLNIIHAELCSKALRYKGRLKRTTEKPAKTYLGGKIIGIGEATHLVWREIERCKNEKPNTVSTTKNIAYLWAKQRARRSAEII